MGDFWRVVDDICVLIGALCVFGALVAWYSVLPVIGLLWMFGAL